jgi:hypothetical protein
VFLFGRLGEEAPHLYPWGFLVAALTSAGLVAAATYRGALFGRWLDQPPLRWIGERSYGIYLWHWPIFMLTRPEDLHLDANLILALRVVLTVSAAALSYACVEAPIRGGLLNRIWADVTTRGRRLAGLGAGALIVTAAAAMIAPVVAILRAPPGYTSPASDVRHALAAAVSSSGLATGPSIKPLPARAAAPAPKLFTGQDVTVVGDSVLLGSLQAINARLPGAQVYAKVGWQARDVLTQLQQLAQSGVLTPVVLIHLGTNGYVYEDQLREILSLLADRQRVIIVNAQVPRRWMVPNDALIDRVLPDYPNAVLVDWRKASAGQRAYFISDQFHLTPAGQRAFVAEIMRAGYLTTSPDASMRIPDLATLAGRHDKRRL